MRGCGAWAALSVALSVIGVAPPAAAKDIVLYGSGFIDETVIGRYFTADGYIAGETIARHDPFDITIELLGNGAGVVTGSFYAPMWPFTSPPAFDGQGRATWTFFTDTTDDVCGGGIGVSIVHGKFSIDNAYCGYLGTVWPYPFIDDLGHGVITRTEIDGIAIPEPAVWSMMVAGFAGLGYLLRRRQKPGAGHVSALGGR